ncbi:MAG: hypothetical protein FP812_14185 [Desulfobacula sp.]|nr:hypothetical protein [Desulfobacula sp.]
MAANTLFSKGRYGYKRTKLAVFLVLAILVFGTASSLAAPLEPELVLVAPQTQGKISIMAGKPVSFFVYFTNPFPAPILLEPYGRLECKLVGKGKSLAATAVSVFPLNKETVPGNGFMKKEYRMDLPPHMEGHFSIALKDFRSNTAMFHAIAFVPGETQLQSEEVAQPTLGEMTDYFQPFTKNLSAYKPVYFLFGVDPGLEKSSFQISFKYQLFDFYEDSFRKENLSFMEKIHLGYTQQSFWDLKSESAPFKDSRYMPEFFFLEDKIDLGLSWISGFGFQTGFQHESNGREGMESRSTNYGYIQPIISFKLWNEIHLKLAPKVWTYLGNDTITNPDLSDYRGYFDIETKIGTPLGLAFETHYRHGKKGPSWQLDMSYPINQLPFLNGILDVYLHAQYFGGYAENLLEYDKRDDIFRLGFSIVR